MARYIDAEKLCKSLRDMAFYQNPYKQSTILGVVSSIESFPTADVAPKSEVVREIFERLHSHRKFDGHTVSVWLNDLVCVAKEYGIDLEGDAELKKKYTEHRT